MENATDQNKETSQPSINETSTSSYSEGDIKMGVHFNPGNRADVMHIKQFCAATYDYLQTQSKKPEFCIGEGMRLKAIAQTFLETFQMNAVKAVTYFDDMMLEGNKWPVGPFCPVDQHPTNGELACTVSFNVGGREDVNMIKSNAAKMYDSMESFGRALENYIQSEDKLDRKAIHDRMKKEKDELAEKGEAKEENKSNAFVAPPPSPEMMLKFRKAEHSRGALGDAFHALRQFQMYAVKAVTR